MYMVTPSVYEKLLNCIDEKQQKILNNLNQKTTNIFNESPAKKFIKNISNDDFIQKENFPERRSPSFEEDENVPPGYRDDDFLPPVNEPYYDMPFNPSMPIIENITPMEYHEIENQPKHLEIPISQGIQTEMPSHQTMSKEIQTEIPFKSQLTQTDIPTKSQNIQTDEPIYVEKGTSTDIQLPNLTTPSTSRAIKYDKIKQKKISFKQPKHIKFQRKKLVITELPSEEIQPMSQEAINYEQKLPIDVSLKKPLEYSKLKQKKITFKTKRPKHVTFQRKKLVITEMEPDEEMIPIQQEKISPIDYDVREPITYKVKLPLSHEERKPIAYQSRKAISHEKKEALEYIKPLKRISKHPQILKEIINKSDSLNYPITVKVPTSIPKITEKLFSKKPPIKISFPTNIPEITDKTSVKVKALKYIPKKTKKLDYNPDVKPYKCDECNLSYATIFNLRRHKKNKHSSSIEEKPTEKFENWLDYPQKRTSTYTKAINPPQKYKKKESFENWI